MFFFHSFCSFVSRFYLGGRDNVRNFHFIINWKFFHLLIISVLMGPTEIPSQSPETIKIPTAHYEFGANYLDPKVCICHLAKVSCVWYWWNLFNSRGINWFSQLMLVGRIMTDGRLNARIKCDLSENLILKSSAQVILLYLQALGGHWCLLVHFTFC